MHNIYAFISPFSYTQCHKMLLFYDYYILNYTLFGLQNNCFTKKNNPVRNGLVDRKEGTILFYL